MINPESSMIGKPIVNLIIHCAASYWRENVTATDIQIFIAV